MPAITWTNKVNVSHVGTILTKNAGANNVANAGGTSTENLTGGGDASIQALSPQTELAQFGLSTVTTLDVASSVPYSFRFGLAGAYEIREAGVYKFDSTYIATDVLKIERTGTTIKYYKNTTLVYTSLTASTGTLTAQAHFWSINDSLNSGLITSTTIPTLSDTTPTTQLTAPATYPTADDTRTVRTLSSTAPTMPAVNETYVDPAFGRTIRRVTSGATGTTANVSQRIVSSAQSCSWSRDSSEFLLTNTGGTIELFSFNETTAISTYVRNLTFTIEPTFSRVNAKKILGLVGFKIQQHDTTLNTYTDMLDIAVVDSAYTGGSFVMGGAMYSSSSIPERMTCFYGGTAQDTHKRVLVCDVTNTANRLILDTQALTINGVAASFPTFLLHAIGMDHSGRYVMLYPTSADIAAGRAPLYVWDVTTGTVLPVTINPSGHDGFGYGIRVNQDGSTGTYDAAKWHKRSLNGQAALDTTTQLISPIMTPAMVYWADHQQTNHLRSDLDVPFFVGSYRYYEDTPQNLESINRINTVAWRAWDNEIFAVPTASIGLPVYRFCHHYANIYADNGGTTSASFWYQPLFQVSPNGRWVLFHSNMLKTLGADVSAGGVGPTQYRTDVFLIDTSSVITTSTSTTTIARKRYTSKTKLLNGSRITIGIEGIINNDYFQDDYFQLNYFQTGQLSVSGNTKSSTVLLTPDRNTIKLPD